jgi:hypothetical protein
MPTGTAVSPPLAAAAVSPRPAPLRFGLRAGLTAAVRGLGLAAAALAGIAPLAVILAVAGILALGVGSLPASTGVPRTSGCCWRCW